MLKPKTNKRKEKKKPEQYRLIADGNLLPDTFDSGYTAYLTGQNMVLAGIIKDFRFINTKNLKEVKNNENIGM